MGFFSFKKSVKEEKQKNKILQKAQRFARKGQIDKAVGEWKSLLTKRADDANIYNTIGDLYLKGKKKADAIEAYQSASRIYRESGFSLKAIAVNKKILKINGNNLESLVCMAELNRERGMINNAKDCYLSIAQYHLKSGSHDQALESYQNIVDMDPKNLKVKIGLAELYLKENMVLEGFKIYGGVIAVLVGESKFEEAEALCQNLEAKNVSPDDIVCYRAQIYLAKGQVDAAHECLQQLQGQSPETPEIAMLTAEILIRQGNADEGMEIIRKVDRGSISEHAHLKIFRFILEAGDLNQAIESLDDIFDTFASTNRFEDLVGLYQEILDHDPNHLRARQKMVDLYKKLKREKEMVLHIKEMGRIHLESGDTEKAKNIFEKVLEMTPGDIDVQAQLRRLNGEPEGVAGADYGEVDLESLDGEPSKETAAGSVYVIEDETEAEAFEAAAADKTSSKGHVKADKRLQETSDSSEGVTEAEQDTGGHETVLADNLTEADVYIKYGHLNKAIVHLEKNLDIEPTHILTHERYLQIFVEQGNTREQINTLMVLSSLYLDGGEKEKSEKALAEVIALDPGHEEALRRRDQGTAPVTSSGPEAPVHETADFSFEFDVSDGPKIDSPAAQEARDGAAVAEGSSDKSVPASTGAVKAESIGELRDEADFYLQHGMEDEARVIYEKILASHPDRSDIAEQLHKISGAEAPEPVTAVEPRAGSASVEGAGGQESPSVAGTKGVGQAPEEPADSSSQSGFAGDFVDFADELRREVDTNISDLLQGGDESGGDGEGDFTADLRREVEQSFTSDIGVFGESDVMDIFSEFREGVQRELGNEDHETHYNLGIAYLEMGLIDEACEEFTVASGDPKREMDCITMVGLCYFQKGEYQQALAELEKGLGLKGRTEDEYIGVRYEIAKVAELLGDKKRAVKELLKIHEANARYRDVSLKLKGFGIQSQDISSGVINDGEKKSKVSYL
jgi:tetratricopeptide (TPR) repeat protein